MTGERTRTVNALTALLRTVALGCRCPPNTLGRDDRHDRRLAPHQHPTTTRTVCRSEAIRLSRRIRALDAELAANDTALNTAVTDQAPHPLDVHGVGPVVAAVVLQAVTHAHPGRHRSGRPHGCCG